MTNRMTMLAICLVIAFIAADAGAQDAVPGWQIGGSVVTTQLDRDDGLIDNNGFGFKAHLQYRFNSWFGLEGAYYNSGDITTDAIPPGEEVKLAYEGGLAQAIIYMPSLMDELDLFVKGGYFNFDVSSSIGNVSSGTGGDSGAVVGAGLSLKMTESMNFRTEFDVYDAQNANLWSLNLGLEYHF